MPKSKAQKHSILVKMEEKINKSKSIFFAKFTKITMSENEQLRRELEKDSCEFYIAPKTITDIALKNCGIEGVNAKKFDGQLAVIFGYADEVAPAKITKEFKKGNMEKIDFLGGILEGKFINAQETTQLADLPGKQELYARLVGSINAPVSGFVNALAGNIRNFVTVLKAIEEKR